MPSGPLQEGQPLLPCTAGSQEAGTYHGWCPGLCRGGQARAWGHGGDQAGLGSGRRLGGTRGPWGQLGGLGLAVGGTHSWSGVLKRVDGRDCGRDQGKQGGRGCGDLAAQAHSPDSTHSEGPAPPSGSWPPPQRSGQPPELHSGTRGPYDRGEGLVRTILPSANILRGRDSWPEESPCRCLWGDPLTPKA